MNLRRWSRNWLLWLALLLPVAQAMADVHALSHAGDRQNDGLVHLDDCDLCLTAANLAGGAPLAATPTLPSGQAVHAAPLAVRGTAPRAEAFGLPPARAPPASA